MALSERTPQGPQSVSSTSKPVSETLLQLLRSVLLKRTGTNAAGLQAWPQASGTALASGVSASGALASGASASPLVSGATEASEAAASSGATPLSSSAEASLSVASAAASGALDSASG